MPSKLLKKSLLTLITALTMTLVLSACIGSKPDQDAPAGTTTKKSATEIPGLTGEETNSEQFQSEGPSLLLQTDIDTYEIIDVKNNQHLPFDQFGGQHDLKKNISPGKSLILFQTNNGEIIIKSLAAGNVVKRIDNPIFSSSFSPELTSEIILNTLSGLSLSEEELQDAISQSYDASILIIRWFNDDQHLFTVKPGGETSTNLHSYDIQSDTYNQLENEDGIVEAFWTSPDSNHVLLKKGFIIDPPYWQDDRYYLLDLEGGSVIQIDLPEDSERPSVFWFSTGYIGIIHQTELVGGSHFSVIDIKTMESRLVIHDSFTGLNHLGGDLLSLHQNDKSQTTFFKISSLSGELLKSVELDGICQINTLFNENECLISCEDKSYRLELETLTIAPFDAPIRMVAFDPNHDQFLLIHVNGHINLCLNPLDECRELALRNEPIEILWLPDSSGFLYRAANTLAYFDLASQAEVLLLTSDFFNDYRNLNAVWLNKSEP